MAQLVKCQTLDFSSGHDLQFESSSLMSGSVLTAQTAVCGILSLRPSPMLSPFLNKQISKKKIWVFHISICKINITKSLVYTF